jgi:hypothetical protein
VITLPDLELIAIHVGGRIGDEPLFEYNAAVPFAAVAELGTAAP